MILHLINKPSVIPSCINTLASGDAILCIEHASDLETVKALQAQLDPSLKIQVYVLSDISDIKKNDSKNIDQIISITNDEFVTLTCSAEKVVSWY
jgi:sulfur transfer complex TusBCD TusB component (DsrH family)